MTLFQRDLKAKSEPGLSIHVGIMMDNYYIVSGLSQLLAR